MTVRKNKILVIGFCISAVFVLSMLISFFVDGGISKLRERNFDLDNFHLAEVTEDQIIECKGECREYMSSTRKTGKASGVSDIYFEDVDRSETYHKAKEITGIKTVSATLAKDCILKIDIQSCINSGKAKIYVIMDNELIDSYDFGESLNLEYQVEGSHEYYIKILCEKAEVEITVKRKYN